MLDNLIRCSKSPDFFLTISELHINATLRFAYEVGSIEGPWTSRPEATYIGRYTEETNCLIEKLECYQSYIELAINQA